MSQSVTGMRDWVVQRVTALYMAVYVILMFAYLASHEKLSYAVWQHLFTVFWAQIGTLIFLVCLMLHAWVGLWTIFTDYIKPPMIRNCFNLLVLLALMVYFFWGVEVIWGIHLSWTF